MFAETAYKRLWWQGYKGRFAAFQWPTTHNFIPTFLQLITDRENYDNGEFIAWRSASPLRNLLIQLNDQCPGQIYLTGHSMGNVVIGEALRLLGRAGKSIINTYVSCEAAVAAECYDPTTVTSFPLNFTYALPYTYLQRNYGPDTPDIYPAWLASSSAGVGTKVNFYNLNDYALSVDVWEFNQISKPDNTGYKMQWSWSRPSGAGYYGG